MSNEVENPEVDESTTETPAGNAPTAEAGDDDVQVDAPAFQEMAAAIQGNAAELSRFQGIKVTVSADLGRAEVPIQTLMDMGEGSVLELNREIDSPVELVAQGVPLACGEVVVVNGCFAIRVTKVYENKRA